MPKALDLFDILNDALVAPELETATVIQQAVPANLPKIKNKEKNKKKTDWKLAVALPDAQIGFRRYEDSLELDPFHDVAAINVALQLVASLEDEYGVDKVINLGDTLDLPMFGKYAQEPTFEGTVNYSLKAAHDFIATQRSVAPSAEIVYIDGNHDCRANKYINIMSRAAVEVRQVGMGVPVFSIPHLINLDSIPNVTHVSGYPADKYYVNPRLVARHGVEAKSKTSTAVQYLNANHHESVIYGHSHRTELMYRSHDTSHGMVQQAAYNPGCLCRIDGAVPSFKGGVMTNLHPVKQYENWQHGMGIIWYKDDGEFSIEHVHIMDGWAVYAGSEFRAKI